MTEQAGKPVAENDAISARKLISGGILNKPEEVSFTNYKLPKIKNLINPPTPEYKILDKELCMMCE